MNEATTLADRYIAAWNEADADARLALVAQTYTEDASYLDPIMNGDGHAGISTMIGAAQSQFPGHRFRRVGDVQEHHGRVRFRWELFPEGGEAVFKGTDIALIEGDRFRDVLGFLD